MKYLRYFALVGLLMLVPLTYAQAEVRIAIGFGPGYVAGPPVCPYGYYQDYPYACAPYGYYGPEWFSGGVFIGAGPWYHRSYWERPYYGRPYAWRDYDHDRGRYSPHPYAGRRFEGRGPERGFQGEGGFHGGNGFHGGRR